MLRTLATMVLALLPVAAPGAMSDLAVVPFFDANRVPLMDTWGGAAERGQPALDPTSIATHPFRPASACLGSRFAQGG